MKIHSADANLLDIRRQLRAVLPGVINELNEERGDFPVKQIEEKHFYLNIEECVNATQFVLIQGALESPKNAGSRQVESLTLDVFIGFTANAYATKEQATLASYRYQAALRESVSRLNMEFGNIRYAGAEPPGSLRIGNKALYGALVRYDIQLF